MTTTVRDGDFAWWPVAAWLAASAVYMLVATLLYWPAPEFAFLSDDSPVSWLSSAQLWAIALLALRLSVERVLPPGAGAWLCVAMVVLAFDEQFMLHENWKYGCSRWWDACRIAWVTEAPIMLVGLAGAATVARLHALLRSRAARVLLWCALGVGVLAIVVDLFGWPRGLVRYEEGLEVIAESMFAGALLGLAAPARTARAAA